MPTIKGPIKISGGFKASEFVKDNADKIKVKLPFEATGFKSSKTPAMADMSGIDMASKPKSGGKFEQELLDLKGVGKKSTEIILGLAKNKTELRKISRKKLIDLLKDDVVEIIDKYLGR
jgi:hypothetical protein